MTHPIYAVTRPPQDDDELHLFVQFAWGVNIPRKRVCPEHRAPFEAFADAYFARCPVSIWKASRGLAGKSYLLATLALTEAVTMGASVSVLGGSGQQSKNVLKYMNALWRVEGSPQHLLAKDPSSVQTELTNGAWIIALLASQTSVRGPHPVRLRLDEIDEMPLEILEAAQGQPMSQGDVKTQTVMSSTHQYADGTMQAMLRRAVERSWGLYEWCLDYRTPILTQRGEIPIAAVLPGDCVASWNGQRFVWKEVEWSHCTGTRRVFRIECANGSTISATGEHEFLTTEGWRKAETLTEKTILIGHMPRMQRTTASTIRRTSENGPVSSMSMGSWVDSRQSSIAEASMFGMQNGDYQNCQTLLGLLAQRINETQQTTCTCLSFRTGKEDVEKTYFKIGEESRRVVAASSSRLPNARSLRYIHSRFSSAEIQFDDRRSWRILAFGPRRSRARQAEGGSVQEGRIQMSCLARRSDTPVVDGVGKGVRIRRITQSREVVPVWDISVRDLHNFVAAGLVVHNCYRETVEPHGWLHPSEVERKRSEISEAMFEIEYNLGEPSIEGRAINTAAVRRLFDPELGSFEGRDGEYIEAEPPHGGARYVTGTDWAKKQDWTVISTWIREPHRLRLVAFERCHRLPWPVMIKKFTDRMARYPGLGAHDATGIGNVVDDYARGQGVYPVELYGRFRHGLFSEHVAAIERDEFAAPDIAFMRDEYLYCRTKDLYDSSGHPPDSFVAGALASWVEKEHGGSGVVVRLAGGSGEKYQRMNVQEMW